MSVHPDVQAIVRQTYGAAAERVARGQAGACCSGTTAADAAVHPITRELYDAAQAEGLPAAALLASLGCGNPTALAELQPGETVLDLGSGGGIDVLLSARRVGPTGTAYGLDMTDPMLALAEQNKRASGLTNVHFLKGEIEHIPLPDQSVDVIISNCVINLSADKDRVLREAYRVLRPGGRFAVSDVVVRGAVPERIRSSMALWLGCVAGALRDTDYLGKLTEAGFEDAAIEVTRIYTAADARDFLADRDTDLAHLAEEVNGLYVSAFVRARKSLTTAKGPGPAPAAATTANPTTPTPADAAAAGCGCAPRGCCGSGPAGAPPGRAA